MTTSTFFNPVALQSADPRVYRHVDGYYYFMRTRSNYLELIQSTRLSHIDEGMRKIICSPEPGVRYSQHLWTPEILLYTIQPMMGEGTIHGGFVCWRMKARIPWMAIGYGRGRWTLLSLGWRTASYFMLFRHPVLIPAYGKRVFKNLNGTGMEHLILVCLSAMIMRSKFHREKYRRFENSG
ncbi:MULTISPECIES: hypothetical protein [Paenibacillus]|uniref:Glycosyl hydrolase family 43 n=1 Tax=Paenibacillus pabuli TaxID=1472 RepID=A0A855Y0P8_9BACL|nr:MULTISPECIES: hypothetical protein [Paenibacillus]PWW33495.1 hypothetical protein DET56_11828 [Paenibacillus pabuli]PXV99758.1 hypothetical protein DEU73_11728 [Paenibacillus taichungensis]RAI87254.1 hypothetical protein DET54_117118 [Paenibacillus pabuli]